MIEIETCVREETIQIHRLAPSTSTPQAIACTERESQLIVSKMEREVSLSLVHTVSKVKSETCLSDRKRLKFIVGEEENRLCKDQIPSTESQEDTEDEFEIAWKYAEQQAALMQRIKLDSSKVLNLLIGDRVVNCGKNNIEKLISDNEYVIDDIIDTFGEILEYENPAVLFVSSHFFSNSENVAVQMSNPVLSFSKNNLNDKRIILIPLNHNNNHWTLLVMDSHSRTIAFIDSMKGKARDRIGMKYLIFLDKFLMNNFGMYYGKKSEEWLLSTSLNNLQQSNDVDCGVFVCYFMDVIAKLTGADSPSLHDKLRKLPESGLDSSRYRKVIRSKILSYCQ